MIRPGIEPRSPNSKKNKTKKNQQQQRTCRIADFFVPANHRAKLKESEKKSKYLDLARELKKNNYETSKGDTNCNWCPWYSHRRIN